MFTREETKQAMLKDCDHYGDSYTLAATTEALAEVFGEVARQQPRLVNLSELDLLTINEHYLYHASENNPTQEEVPWWQKLRACVIYLDRFLTPSNPATVIVPNPLDLLIPIITFYGGAVTEVLDAGTTRAVTFYFLIFTFSSYIVTQTSSLPRKICHGGGPFVVSNGAFRTNTTM